MIVAVAASPSRAGWRSVIAAAFVVTLVRPASWVFGLAGFLAGGGIVLVAWPILVLPTPTGVQNALGGPVSTLVFGGVSATLALVFLAALAGVVAVVVLATVVGAWAERHGIRVALEAAVEEGLGRPPIPGGTSTLDGAPGSGAIAVVRLLSLVPVIAVLAVAWAPVYDAAYHQLILPDELVTPLPIRVMRDVPELVAVILATWLAADTAAAVGVRRLVLERHGVLRAWLLGWADLVRHPLRVLATALAGLVVTWVAIWLAGLVLTGVGSAFRAAAFTLELEGRRRR